MSHHPVPGALIRMPEPQLVAPDTGVPDRHFGHGAG